MLTIHPAETIYGTITVPGDKSISHRALLLAALADGESSISNLAPGNDVQHTLLALRALGIQIHQSGTQVHVRGSAGQPFPAPAGLTIDCGNSGTTARMLCGLLAAMPGVDVTLIGDASLSRRPMLRVIEPLRAMGADISASDGGTLPLRIRGRDLTQLDWQAQVPSAQVKSALLLAAFQSGCALTYLERIPSRDHTERLLLNCGVPLESSRGTLQLPAGNPPLSAFDVDVPGDFSSAAAFLALASCRSGYDVNIKGVGLNPLRTGMLACLHACGVKWGIKVTDDDVEGESSGNISISGVEKLEPFVIEEAFVPAMVDEIPLLALVATQCQGESVISGAGELRVKESDRLARVAEYLRAMGAQIDEQAEGMTITGPAPLRGVEADSAGDHRMAMLLAVAGVLNSDPSNPMRITGEECLAVSYPGFIADLQSLGVRVDVSP